jgi:hypothetical protein
MASLEGPGIRSLMDVDITIMTPSPQLGQLLLSLWPQAFPAFGVQDGARVAGDELPLDLLCFGIRALHQAMHWTSGVVCCLRRCSPTV